MDSVLEVPPRVVVAGSINKDPVRLRRWCDCGVATGSANGNADTGGDRVDPGIASPAARNEPPPPGNKS